MNFRRRPLIVFAEGDDNVKKIGSLILSILIPLGVGALSGYLTRDGIELFGELNKPPLSPPAAVFPVVWTILYALMGVSAWLIANSDADTGRKKSALIIYGIQLAVNFFWSIIFFTLEMYLAAFFWLAFLWIWVYIMIKEFGRISKTAAILQIPYILWLTFAAYLNLGVYFLN